jgi:hypothetical protein
MLLLFTLIVFVVVFVVVSVNPLRCIGIRAPASGSTVREGRIGIERIRVFKRNRGCLL